MIVGATIAIVLTRGRGMRLLTTFGAGVGSGVTFVRLKDAYRTKDFREKNDKDSRLFGLLKEKRTEENGSNNSRDNATFDDTTSLHDISPETMEENGV